MSRAELFLGLDLGGTGAKAGVFDHAGAPVGLGHCVYAPRLSPDGRVEIPIEDIYEGARTAVRQALGSGGARIRAMAVSSQGQTFVTLDADDRPLHPAIVWYDSRAQDQADRLSAAIAGRTTQPPLVEAIASAPKIMWLRERHPDLMGRARRYLLLPDYIAYRLTGEAVTDANTAASTALYAEGAADYDAAALAAAEIGRDQVARIRLPGEPIARLRSATAAEWGLDADTLLVAGTNDQYAGALGAGNCRPGIVSETSGTCLALLTLAARQPTGLPPGLFGGCFPIAPYGFALAYSKTAGVVLDWFRRECCAGESFAQLEALAARSPIGSHGLTALPHFDGMISPAPHPAARGLFAFLTLQHTRGDLYRALLEALTFSLLENMRLLRASGFAVETVRAIGGGARSEFWLQMKADALGQPIEQPVVTEAAVLGAAMLAAAGAGVYRSLAEASAALYRVRQVFAPDAARQTAYQEPYRRYQELKARLYPTA